MKPMTKRNSRADILYELFCGAGCLLLLNIIPGNFYLGAFMFFLFIYQIAVLPWMINHWRTSEQKIAPNSLRPPPA